MLLDILKNIKSETGRDYIDAGQRAITIARVNDAAEEVYFTQDLEGSLDEQVFDLAVDSQLVALPWYAEYVRGWRWFDSRMHVTVNDIKNRYNHGIGEEVWNQQFRSIRYSSINREIENETRLTLTLANVETSDFTVTITGATAISEKVIETIIIPAGTLEVESTKDFKSPIYSIKKSAPTQYNINVSDAEGNILALLPNHRTETHYHIIQILDVENSVVYTTFSGVEVLYKKIFNPLFYDNDVFLEGSRYDKAIFWKYMEHQSKDPESAVGYQAKSNQIIDRIKINAKVGKSEKINFSPNPYFGKCNALYGFKYRLS